LLESMMIRQSTETLEAEAGQRGSMIRFVQPNSAWLSSLEWTVVAALAVAFATRSLMPAWQTLKSEFPNYYLAAKLYRHHIPLDRIYEWTWFQRQNDHLGVRDGLVSFAPNPPTLILASVPLAGLQPLAAKRAWLILSLVFLGLALAILHRVTSLSWRRLLLISLLCVLPLNSDFLFARHYVFLLFLICASYYAASLGRHGTSGAVWSVAAGMKLFPAVVVILFLRQRNWRALAGFLIGLAVLGGVSVAMFGAEVHRVFLREVLSQASRGDWLGPYVLSQNSFTTLWSRLFLFEPELNPFPLVNSPFLYAAAMAITVTIMIGVFLRFIGDGMPDVLGWQWASLIPLMLLLCTNTAFDYWCVLIFSATVGADLILAKGNSGNALILLVMYVTACTPLPVRISSWFPSRLLATVAIFVWLLRCARVRPNRQTSGRWLAAGLISAAALTIYNLQTVRNREEDFSRRVQTLGTGYRFANPVPVAGAVVYTEMQPTKYGVALLVGDKVHEIPLSGDALSVAGSSMGTRLYAERTGRQSFLVRLSADEPWSVPGLLTEGQEPVLSSNGKWLAFLREEQGKTTAWLRDVGSGDEQAVLANAYQPLDLTVTDDGDVIAAGGNVSDPHLLRFVRNTQKATTLSGFPGPTRYPSISPDGRRLAFSRRDLGFWHLYVRDLASGSERQLTHARCNTGSPSWVDTRTLLYATDCGRGVGLSAIDRVILPD
jgi:hypothetical protein